MEKLITPFKRYYYLVLLSIIVSACSGTNISMPISDGTTGINREGEVVWIDLVTSDAGRSQSFFTQLSGWQYNNFGAYSRAMSGTKPVCGIIQDPELERGEKNSYWIVSASVGDVKGATERVIENDGKVIAEERKIPQRGKVAVIQDSQGAVLALMHSTQGDLRATTPREGEWMWVELWTNEPQAASNFYQDVLDVEGEVLSGEDNYYLLKSKKRAFAGITETLAKEEEPIWIPILSVADVESSTSKALELKGSVLVNPIEVSGHKVSLITTPNGAPFMLQEIK